MSAELLIKLGVEQSSASRQISEVTKELTSLQKQMSKIDTNTNDFNKNMTGMAQKCELTKQKISGLESNLSNYNQKLKDAETRLEKAKQRQEELANATGTTKEEMDKANRELDNATTHFNNMNRKIAETEQALDSANDELKTLNQTMTKMPFDNLANKLDSISNGFKNISSATAPLTLAVGGLFGASINSAMNFEQSMLNVQAVSGATAQEMEALTAKAKEMGETTEFSASQAADAIYYMQLAGWDASQSLAGLPAVLDLATASGMDLALASDVVTDSLTSFKMEAEDASSFCDVLAKTSASSNTTVQMLGEAFKNVAPVAGAMGYSVEDVSLALGLLANNGIKSAESGNKLKTILANLAAPTTEMKKAMDQYNISLVDSEGNTKSLNDVLKNLRQAFSGLDEVQRTELATTLAGKESMAALLAIVNTGEDDFNKLASAIADSENACSDMANTMRSSSKNSVEELKSKLEGLAISIGEKLLPSFVKILEKIGELIDWFASLDDETQNSIIQFGLLVAAISPVTGAIGSLIGGLSSAVSSLGELAAKMVGTGSIGGAMTQTATTVTTSSSSIIATLGQMATAFAPYLIGGAIVVGVAAGAKIIYDEWQEMQRQQTLLADSIEGEAARIEQANDILMQNFSDDYAAMKKDIEDFKNEGALMISQAFLDAQEPTQINLDALNSSVSSKLTEIKATIEERNNEIKDGLSLFNSNVTDDVIFTLDDINNITNDHLQTLIKDVDVAYNTLLTMEKNKNNIGKTMIDEYGNEYVYTVEQYQDDVQKAYADYCDALLDAEAGYYDESLNGIQSFVNRSEITTYKAYTQAIKDAKKQKDDMVKIAEEEKNDKILTIQGMSDEMLEKAGYTRDELLRIAELQHEQQVNEIEMLYQDAVEKYTDMAEDSTTITKEQKENTVNNAKEMREKAAEEISKLQDEIDKLKSKDVNVAVNFSTTGYENTLQRMNSLLQNGKSPYYQTTRTVSTSPYSVPTPRVFTDAPLEAAANTNISAYATQDAEATRAINNAVSNFNYVTNNTHSSIRSTSKSSLEDKLDQLLNKFNGNQSPSVELSIENFINESKMDIQQLMKEISYYMNQQLKF